MTFEKMLLKDLMEEFGVIIQDKRTDSMTHSSGVVTGRVERIPGGLLTFRGCRADYCGITILRL